MPSGELGERDHASADDARGLRHVGRQHQRDARLQLPQHFAQRLKSTSLAHLFRPPARAANGDDAQPFQHQRIGLRVAIARD